MKKTLWDFFLYIDSKLLSIALELNISTNHLFCRSVVGILICVQTISQWIG